ncbi:MAG: plastocyanin/azurin family copper-binding protein, partial [Actinomycetota bacterium]|nr:plastocyanin/azurin family copper-binding protein [Actinomycetota bacterium]
VAALAACGPGAGASAGPETVTLTVRHSRFTPSVVDVRPGTTVRFVVRNLDPIAHELIVGDQAAQDVHERGTETHHGERPGEVSVPAGATVETTYTFPAASGPVLLGCHLPGHWDYGMRGTVRVG